MIDIVDSIDLQLHEAEEYIEKTANDLHRALTAYFNQEHAMFRALAKIGWIEPINVRRIKTDDPDGTHNALLEDGSTKPLAPVKK